MRQVFSYPMEGQRRCTKSHEIQDETGHKWCSCLHAGAGRTARFGDYANKKPQSRNNTEDKKRNLCGDFEKAVTLTALWRRVLLILALFAR